MSAPASARAVLGRGMRATQASETGHQAAKNFFVEVRGSGLEGLGRPLAAPCCTVAVVLRLEIVPMLGGASGAQSCLLPERHPAHLQPGQAV